MNSNMKEHIMLIDAPTNFYNPYTDKENLGQVTRTTCDNYSQDTVTVVCLVNFLIWVYIKIEKISMEWTRQDKHVDLPYWL